MCAGVHASVLVSDCTCGCVCASVCQSLTNICLSRSLSLFTQTRMSARSLAAQCVVPGAARTPSAPTGASWAASPVSREKTPQTVVSGQTTYS